MQWRSITSAGFGLLLALPSCASETSAATPTEAAPNTSDENALPSEEPLCPDWEPATTTVRSPILNDFLPPEASGPSYLEHGPYTELTWEWTVAGANNNLRQIIIQTSASHDGLPEPRPTPSWAAELGFPETTQIAPGTALRTDMEFREGLLDKSVMPEQVDAWYQLEWEDVDGSHRALTRGVGLQTLLDTPDRPTELVVVEIANPDDPSDGAADYLETLIGMSVASSLESLAASEYCILDIAEHDDPLPLGASGAVIQEVTLVGPGVVSLDVSTTRGDDPTTDSPSPVPSEDTGNTDNTDDIAACDLSALPQQVGPTIPLLSASGGLVLLEPSTGSLFSTAATNAEFGSYSAGGGLEIERTGNTLSISWPRGGPAVDYTPDPGEQVFRATVVEGDLVVLSGRESETLVVRRIERDGTVLWESSISDLEAFIPITTRSSNGSLLIGLTYPEGASLPALWVALDSDGNTTFRSREPYALRSAGLLDGRLVTIVDGELMLDGDPVRQIEDLGGFDISGGVDGYVLLAETDGSGGLRLVDLESGAVRPITAPVGCRLSSVAHFFEDSSG